NLGIPLAPLSRARRKESVDTEWARIGVVTKDSSLSLCAKRAADFQRLLRRLRAPMATGPVALEPPSSPQPFQPTSTPGCPELAGKSCFPTEASGARQDYKRHLRRIEVARTICRRSAQDPPPGHL
ncbi:hypothetical protein Prudu_005648, partial [Prunus dulcis]